MAVWTCFSLLISCSFRLAVDNKLLFTGRTHATGDGFNHMFDFERGACAAGVLLAAIAASCGSAVCCNEGLTAPILTAYAMFPIYLGVGHWVALLVEGL